MARTYPPITWMNTQSQAERTLYTAFAQQLDDAYAVFHHVGWLAHDQRKHPLDGQADFVIAYPDRGVLVIEVKGGTIRRDGKSGRWTSTGSNGVTNDIAEPVEQAKGSKSNKKDHSYVCSHRCKWASWSPCDQTSAYPGSRQSDHRHHA